LLVSCSSGGGGGTSGIGFQLTRISVLEGAVWEVNREIEFTFSENVDFSTVSNNTINIQTTSGEPATGSFFVRAGAADTIVFQPNCPTMADLSDAGLKAGGFQYVITVPGDNSGAANTVLSTSQEKVGITQVRNFSTPASLEPSSAFLDTTLGPPVPVVRSEGSSDTQASYIRFGDNDSNRVYFERDANQNLVLSDPAFEMPLNLYSDPSTRVAVFIEFNQAVNPDASNLSSNNLRLEFQELSGMSWVPLETRVVLVQNCTSVGARVRLDPVGVLPANSSIRAVVRPGFQDLVGQTNLLNIDNFAQATTTNLSFTSLAPPNAVSDELFEGFAIGGTTPDSLQDVNAAFDVPAATWEGGRLTAAFDFEGDGGPGGDFDWVINPGQILFFDTTAQVIIGGPGGNPTTSQNAVNGVVNVRNLTIMDGGELRVQGPNALRINATGDVVIDGRLEASGFNARDVATLNTGNQVEVGGAGVAGGGRGGNASEVITNSTPRGGTGQGPFGILNAGGFGGESGFAPKGEGKDARRPGGGGGGRFASDARMLADFDMDSEPDNPGEEAQAGLNGHPSSRGALTMVSPSRGGQPGGGPFTDNDDSNDFFGTMAVPDGMGGVASLVRGELTRVLAGYGGGGGGEAVPFSTFPAPNWNPGSDEKGGPGGGGGGAVYIRSLRNITVGVNGEIFAKGGRGATGENTLFLDHVGGTGGSASGGHVILEAAGRIIFSGMSATDDRIDASGGPTVIGPMADIPANISYGGTGSGGVIQLHVPNAVDPVGPTAADDIQIPLLSDIGTTPEEKLDTFMSPVGYVLIPTYGARSRARSKWISLGGASVDPANPSAPDIVNFLFDGISPDATGRVPDMDMDGEVDELSPLVDELLTGSATVALQPSGLSMTFTGSALTNLVSGSTLPNGVGTGVPNDMYLRTPALLDNFVLRLEENGNTANFQDSIVTSATYNEGAIGIGDEVLTLNVGVQPDGMSTMNDFAATLGGTTQARIIPRFYRVITAGQADALPTNSFVNIRFQAARDDGNGSPDEANPVVDFTGDINAFNQANLATPGEIQFFRFEVEFDLTGGGGMLDEDTEPVSLDFLRIPYLF